MDPLSSLGVAGNVIQFVDFGIKLVTKFNQIYSSADGALQENTELSDVAERLKTIANPLAQSTHGSDPELQKIAQSCHNASNELLEFLRRLQNQASKHRKLSAARITLKSVIKEGVIRELDNKIQRLQRQLNTTLLTLLHDSNGRLATQITEIIDSNQRFQLETRISLSKLIRELEKFQILSQSAITIPEIGQQIGTLTEESKLAEKRRRILKSLRYDIMYDRFEDVVEAYGETFQWVLNDPALGFSRWLESPSTQTYWITGKPGSGKSTLMKYIHQQPRTQELLREWAGSHHLVIANHFFWVSGDQLQRRQIGLLRSLLFQILRECPHLVATVCATRWNEDELTWDEPWNLRALSSCFERLGNNEDHDVKICLFVDGLDEYDGDHRGLTRLLRNLMTSSKSQFFKLCVSSRPWNVFEAEYGALEVRLNVHELTSKDILLYVDRNLRQDEYLHEMFTADHHRGSELIHMINKKAQGVFLWVYYVVRLLLKTAVDYPTMSDLVKMVDDYPDELDPLFDRILAAIPKAYHQDTARMIKICLESVSPPPLVVLWFAEQVIEDESYALYKDIAGLTKSDLSDIRKFRQRLKGRCMDFIEVHLSQSPQDSGAPQVFLHQVDFFHRTVRDFLHMKKEWFDKWAGETFDVHLAMCRANFVLLKTLPPLTVQSRKDRDKVLISRALYQFFASAHILETERGLPIGPLLEQLDVIFRIWNTGVEDFRWSNVIHQVFYQGHGSVRPISNTDLFDVAVQTGLLLYVKEKIRPNLPRQTGRLLHQALVPEPLLVGFSALHPEVIHHLLNCGADPNDSYSTQSAWCEFLLQCLKASHQCLDSASVETIELLLQYGANADTVCYMQRVTGTQNAAMSVEGILRRVHPNKNRLVALLDEARARRQLDTGIPEQQDTGRTSPAGDPQSAALEPENDVELRTNCPESTMEARNEGAELPGDSSETPGQSRKPRVEKPELRKLKRRWRVWAFLKRIST